MREHDYAALAESAQRGDFEPIEQSLGVVFTREALAAFHEDLEEFSLFSLPAILATIGRAAREPSGIAWERTRGANGFYFHTLVVFWERKDGSRRVTAGIGTGRGRKSISEVWPMLDGWKAKLELNAEAALRWAMAKEKGSVALEVTRRDDAPRDSSIDEDALLAAIVAAPEDDAPRLVYADWLLERGDARGEFIRLQVEEARSAKWNPRVRQMIEAGWRNLAGELAPFTNEHAFDRGFPRWVTLSAAAFARHGERFFSRWPLQQLRLDNQRFTSDQLAQVASAPGASLVRELRVAQAKFANNRRGLPLAALAKHGGFPALRTLVLTACGARADDWEELFMSLDAPVMTAVVMSSNHSHPALFRALGSSKTLPALRVVEETGYYTLGTPPEREWVNGLKALAQRSSLECVRLSFSKHLGDDALRTLFDRSARCRLREFSLGSTSATDELLAAIVKSPSAKRLREIRLFNGRFTLKGVLPLLRLPLEVLNVSGGFRERAWPEEDIDALLEAMEALPTTHPLRAIGLPARKDRNVEFEKHPRFAVESSWLHSTLDEW